MDPDDFVEMEGGYWVLLTDGIDCFGREIRHWYWQIDEGKKRAKGEDQDADVEVDKSNDEDDDTNDDKGGKGDGEGEDIGGESATKKPKIES